MRQNRRSRPAIASSSAATVVAVALAAAFAGDADAGDLIAHHLIAQRACRQYLVDHPNPLTNGLAFPAEGDCGSWAEMPDLWAPYYHNPDGKETEVGQFTRVGTADLVDHIRRTLGPIDNRLTAGLPNAGLAGNWYHFRNNGFDLWNATGGANDASKHIRDNAVDFLRRHAVGGDCSVTIKGETWNISQEYWRRVLASTHLDPGDGYCHQHAGGNTHCQPGRDAGPLAIRNLLTGRFDVTTCSGYVAQAWDDAINRRITCDQQIRVPYLADVPAMRLGGRQLNRPFRIPGQRLSWAAGVMRGAEVAAPGARAGAERTIGHHCNVYNPTLACSGPDMSDPRYCECEIYGANMPANGVTAVTNAADGIYVLSDDNAVNGMLEPQVKRTYDWLDVAVTAYNNICTKKEAKQCGADTDCNDYCATLDNDPTITVNAFCQ